MSKRKKNKAKSSQSAPAKTAKADANEVKASEAESAEVESKDAEAAAAESEDAEAAEESEPVSAKADDADDADANDADDSDADADADADDSDADADAESDDSDADADADDADDADADDSDADDESESVAASAADDSDADADDSDSDADDDDADEPAAAAGGAGRSGSADLDAHEDGELYGLLAEFKTPGELIAAAEKIRDAGYTRWDCYSPFPVHGIDPAMGIKRTILPVIVLVVGISGLIGGLLLQWYTNAFDWPWIVSGKPFFSLPANIPITFETTILASVFASFFGMWGLNKLPQHWHPFFSKDRFRKASDDGFFVGIEAADGKFQRGKTQALLEELGATAVETCYVSTDPRRLSLPKPVVGFIIVSLAVALVPFALVAKARTSKSEQPRWHIFPDMDFQPKGTAQAKSDLFADGRVSRMPVAGTVARGHLKADDHFYRGIDGGQWATSFPAGFEVSMEAVEEGRKQYGIFCQPCHGAVGQGDGMVHRRASQLGRNVRGWVQPTNLHQGTIVRQPHGQLFNTITHGIRTMPGYASQIPEADRWSIVLYVRALQRSQNANINDVPNDARSQIRQ